jgi:hypothetical protein
MQQSIIYKVILRDNGRQGLAAALEAVRQHLDYQTDHNSLNGISEIYQRFLRLIKINYLRGCYMKKKAVLCVILLLAVSLSAESFFYDEWMVLYDYMGNGSTERLYATFVQRQRQYNGDITDKLPTSVHQAISLVLGKYSLSVGDAFYIVCGTRKEFNHKVAYNIFLRITNNNGTYEWYAFRYVL